MSIVALINAHESACARLRQAVMGRTHCMALTTIENELEALERSVLAVRPRDETELLAKMTFVQELVGSAIGQDGPEKLWFDYLRRDVLALTK